MPFWAILCIWCRSRSGATFPRQDLPERPFQGPANEFFRHEPGWQCEASPRPRASAGRDPRVLADTSLPRPGPSPPLHLVVRTRPRTPEGPPQVLAAGRTVLQTPPWPPGLLALSRGARWSAPPFSLLPLGPETLPVAGGPLASPPSLRKPLLLQPGVRRLRNDDSSLIVCLFLF